MSSILDALDKLDTATTPVGGTLRSVRLPRKRRRLGRIAALGAVVVSSATLAGMGAWSWSARPSLEVPAAPASAAAPAVAAAPEPLRRPAGLPSPRGNDDRAARWAAARRAPLAGVGDDELPWAEPTPTAEDMPAPEVREPLPRVAMARVAPAAPPARDLEPLDYYAAREPEPLDAEPMPADFYEPAATPPARSQPPAGAPDVRLNFLMYSSAPERRTVSIRVGGGTLASLHEGESAEGFEVVAIHRDRAELRFGGERFDLWPR